MVLINNPHPTKFGRNVACRVVLLKHSAIRVAFQGNVNLAVEHANELNQHAHGLTQLCNLASQFAHLFNEALARWSFEHRLCCFGNKITHKKPPKRKLTPLPEGPRVLTHALLSVSASSSIATLKGESLFL
jgi:hypothetical protein